MRSRPASTASPFGCPRIRLRWRCWPRGVPVAAPSANRFSRPSPTTAAHVLADLEGGSTWCSRGGGRHRRRIDDRRLHRVAAGRAPRGRRALRGARRIVPALRVADASSMRTSRKWRRGNCCGTTRPRAQLTVYAGEPSPVVSRSGATRGRWWRAARGSACWPLTTTVALAPGSPPRPPAAASRWPAWAAARRAAAARALFAALRALDGARWT